MMKKFFFILIIIFSCPKVLAKNIINITDGNSAPILIAINNFAGNLSEEKRIASDIVKVISDDCNSSGIFRSIPKVAFIENKIGLAHKPLFAAWQQINATLLVNGDVTKLPSGKLSVRFILWDVILEKEMLSEAFEISEKIWRRVAHKISDQIYCKITGYQGYFNTRIAYVAESGSYLNRKKRLALMDQDGANHQFLTDGKDLVLTPKFSPDGKKILYLSYKNKIPQVHMLDLVSGKKRLIGDFPGMSFAPRFAQDGEHILLSIAKSGRTHIYEINLKNKRRVQLTEGNSINTSSSYSPDGKQIVFNSDREGRRQIFVMNRDGSAVTRISYGDGAYSEPEWSSRNYISFTKISKDHGFTIGVMRPYVKDGQNTERLIANGYLVESSSWAKNGRTLAFSRGYRPSKSNNNSLNKIYSIDFTGRNEKLIKTPHDASDPNWSPPID